MNKSTALRNERVELMEGHTETKKVVWLRSKDGGRDLFKE